MDKKANYNLFLKILLLDIYAKNGEREAHVGGCTHTLCTCL